ncbi:hypothetical protein F4777DRAFT_596383 [Nemania sp. FL0916]|nr:hypothetical protein F4777DRAFT_596383 [Nemania sp. FL0916]
MAEAFSIAASGIAVYQVATQVGKSITKLRKLWHDLQDVPASIEDLFDQIECLDPALWEADHTFNRNSLPPIFWDSSIASRSTAYCRKALVSLTELVDELASQLQIHRPGRFKGKIIAVKVVLKKEQLRVLERRLQNAVRMLALAQQSYLIALAKIQPHIITQGFTEIAAPIIAQALQNNSPRDQFYSQEYSSLVMQKSNRSDIENPRNSLKRHANVKSTRFRLPTWVCRIAWELQSSKSYGGWKLNLRYYHIVPEMSRVLITAEKGDPEEIQALFEDGMASPWDRGERSGQTLLHRAVTGANMPMIAYLINLGADPYETSYDGDYPVKCIYYSIFDHSLWGRQQKSLSLEQCIFDDQFKKLIDVLSPDSDDIGCTCRYTGMPREWFKMIQVTQCPSHEKTTLESRITSLLASSWPPPPNPLAIPDLLEPYWSQDLRALCTTFESRFPLITIVAFGLGVHHSRLNVEWPPLVEQIMRYTPDVHAVRYHRVPNSSIINRLTPLMALIKGILYKAVHDHLSIRLHYCVRLWLQNVRSAGYDLQEYGRRENDMLADRSHKLDKNIEICRWNEERTGVRYETAYLRGYVYGPEPKDWKILLSNRDKGYAADFWRLAEGKLQPMPGAWVEDSDDDQYDGWSDDNDVAQDDE